MQSKFPDFESKLAENDLLRIMHITKCQEVYQSTKRKSKLDAKRSVLISQKGLDSPEYTQQLVADTKEVTGLQRVAIEEATNNVSFLNDILIRARNSHKEEMKNNESATVMKKFLGLFIFQP